MKRDTLLLAAIPCAIAAAASHGLLDAAMRGWPTLVAVAVVTLGLTAKMTHRPANNPLRCDPD